MNENGLRNNDELKNNDDHHWPKGTICIIGDFVQGLDEHRLKNGTTVKVRCFPGSNINIYIYIFIYLFIYIRKETSSVAFKTDVNLKP